MLRSYFSRHTARAGSAVLLLQRAPLLKLLPEARVLTSSGFTDALRWSVTAVAGLGAFDSVSGATEVVQLQPASGSSIVPGVAGDPLVFVWQATGPVINPALFTVAGNLPPGMTHAMTGDSSVDSMAGVPAVAGDYPITISAWRNSDFTGDFIEQAFTLRIVNPPAPEILVPPAAGNHAQGEFVVLTAQHTGGRSFTWTRNGDALEPDQFTLFATTAPRRYRPAPTSDPGPAWRSGGAFDDSTWTAVSGGVGYDTNNTEPNYTPLVATTNGNVRTAMSGTSALHLRLPFTLPQNAALGYLRLRVHCDDGFVAWINGTEVVSQNKPATLQWNSQASAPANDDTAFNGRTFDISAHLPLLRAGENLLAIQAMNRAPAPGDDFLFNCELLAGLDAVNSPSLVFTALQPSQTGDYQLTVTNPAASVSTESIGLYIPPLIVQQPASAHIPGGSTAELNVTATGSDPFTFQWFTGPSGDTSQPISGAVEESYISPPLTTATSYWVRVTNGGGSVDSATANITIAPPAVENFGHWAAANFSPAQLADPLLSAPSADPDADGLTNSAEYALGTLPLSFTGPALAIAAPAALSFTAAAASGPGYAGRTRRYTLERASSLNAGPWVPVDGFANITGSGQLVTHTPASNAPAFYRLRVELLP